jgi:excisionase family DNA binding protein
VSKHLNVKQAADDLGVSVDQIKKLITGGELPAVNVGIASRAFWRIAQQDLDAWVEKRRKDTARQYGGDAA